MTSPEINERISWLHYIREIELNRSLELVHLAPKARVLDFGSGDGFNARLLAQQGFQVIAVDVAPRHPQQYPVIRIGAPELPFADNSFDFVFSSNVLEHVQDLSATLSEVRRVLKPPGAAVFTMPTPAWRLYTLLEIPLRVAFSARLERQPLYYTSEPKKGEGLQVESNTNRSRRPLLARAFAYIMRPHGEFPSALHELVSFSPGSWRCVFEQNGFGVVTILPLPIIYGNMLFPWRWFTLRKKLVNKCTASCIAYYVTTREQ